MGTNLIISKSSEEFLAGYTPVYNPIYPLLTSQNAQQYAMEVAERTFRRAAALGDIRNKRITPKDTELKRLAIGEASKSFKAYMYAQQFVRSTLQSDEGVEDGFAQALEEHQKMQDEILLFGDGTADNNVINNGLYWSGDANRVLESSEAIADLLDFHATVVSAVNSRSVGGERTLFFYGDTVLSKLDSIHASGAGTVLGFLEEVLGGVNFVRLPSTDKGGVIPSGANGILILNHAQVKTHYVTEPIILARGVNEQAMEAWANFIQGSMMVEVVAYGGLTKVPFTF